VQLNLRDHDCAQLYANIISSGNHWAVESEIFWKARGGDLSFTEAAIACVFKKFAEATARWYDAGERVGRSGSAPVISTKIK
jgi:hypothetical protein